MPIAVICSQCGKTYQVPDNRAGQKGKCSCGAEIEVPAIQAPAPAAFTAPPAAAPLYQAPAPATTLPDPSLSGASGLATAAPPITVPDYSVQAPTGRVPRVATEEPNLIMAIVVGAVAAALGAFLWYGVVALTHIQSGFVAIGVGFVVGFGVVIGAGGKGDVKLQILSAILTLVSLGYSEYLILRHFANPELAAKGFSLPLLPPPDVAIGLIGISLKEDPLTLVFWAIALWTAFKLPSEKEQEPQ